MGKANFSDDFKWDAVAQITERGYLVAEVSRRLGVSTRSLYEWKRKFSTAGASDNGEDAEIRTTSSDTKMSTRAGKGQRG